MIGRPIVAVGNVSDWLTRTLTNVRCAEETKTYVVNVFSNPSFSREIECGSIVLAYAKATQTHDFRSYQEIGDWALFHTTIAGDDEVLRTFGTRSYAACDRFLRHSWALYGELASNFDFITKQARLSLYSAP